MLRHRRCAATSAAVHEMPFDRAQLSPVPDLSHARISHHSGNAQLADAAVSTPERGAAGTAAATAVLASALFSEADFGLAIFVATLLAAREAPLLTLEAGPVFTTGTDLWGETFFSTAAVFATTFFSVGFLTPPAGAATLGAPARSFGLRVAFFAGGATARALRVVPIAVGAAASRANGFGTAEV